MFLTRILRVLHPGKIALERGVRHRGPPYRVLDSSALLARVASLEVAIVNEEIPLPHLTRRVASGKEGNLGEGVEWRGGARNISANYGLNARKRAIYPRSPHEATVIASQPSQIPRADGQGASSQELCYRASFVQDVHPAVGLAVDQGGARVK